MAYIYSVNVYKVYNILNAADLMIALKMGWERLIESSMQNHTRRNTTYAGTTEHAHTRMNKCTCKQTYTHTQTQTHAHHANDCWRWLGYANVTHVICVFTLGVRFMAKTCRNTCGGRSIF